MTIGVKPAGRMKELADIRASKGELLPLLKEQMLLGMDDDDRDTTGLHVSDLVHTDTCHRLVSARMLGLPIPKDKFVFSRENVFAEGNAIHAKWQHRMRRTGKLWGQWKCRICNYVSDFGFEPPPAAWSCLAPGIQHIWKYKEIPFKWEPLLLQGHADGGMGTGIIEIKSLGLGTLRFEAPRILAENTATHKGRSIPDLDGIWNDIRRPFPSHIRQGNMYCWLAAQLGMPFDHIVFLYEAKWHQQVKEFTVQPSSLIMEPMLEAAEKISSAVLYGKLASCQHGSSCKQCEAIDEDSPVSLGVADWPREPDGSYTPDSAGYKPVYLGAPAGEAATPDPAEPAGNSGPGTNGLVPGDQRMGEIPAAAAGNGRSRRIRRRTSDEQPGSTGTSPVRGENSNGNEGVSPGRRVVRRRG